jgi:hypothetical protein
LTCCSQAMSRTMIETYLDRGDMFVLYDRDLVSVCVVTHEGDGICELKNIATYEEGPGAGLRQAAP